VLTRSPEKAGASLDSGRGRAGKNTALCSSAMPTASSSSYASAPPHFSDSEDEKSKVASLLTTLTSATRLAPAARRGARGKYSNSQSGFEHVSDVAHKACGPRQDELSALLAAGIATGIYHPPRIFAFALHSHFVAVLLVGLGLLCLVFSAAFIPHRACVLVLVLVLVWGRVRVRVQTQWAKRRARRARSTRHLMTGQLVCCY